MEDKKNNELRSRREFFKKAAKGALPILGAIVLASTPILSQAAKSSMGCDTCRGGCGVSCQGTCYKYCKGSCIDNCAATCGTNCRQGCASSSSR